MLLNNEARAKVIESLAKLSLARLTSHSTLTIHDLTREFVMAYARARGDNSHIHVAVRLEHCAPYKLLNR